jgi:hypothetical protein
MILRMQSAISLLTCSCLISVATAATSDVGLVMTTGKVQVNGAEVPGTAAIFSGSLIATGDRSSSIQFADGSSAVMKPGAMMTVYRENSVLRQGVVMQSRVDKHPVLANGLRISGATPNAAVQIGVKGASYTEVAAQQGESDVWTESGHLVARVEPGKTLNFTLNAAAGSPANGVTLSGILRPHSLLVDDITNVTYQLQGGNLQPLVGESVQVSGTVLGGNPSSSTPQVVAVSNITRLTPYAAMGGGGGGQAQPSSTNQRAGTIAFLVFVAAGISLLAYGLSGGFGTSPSAVTPITP